MKTSYFYLVMCVLGTVLPLSHFYLFWSDSGMDLILLLQQVFINHASSAFAADVILSALVALVFMVIEGRRIGLPLYWLPMVTIFMVGLSLGLPLFLYLRHRFLETQDRS